MSISQPRIWARQDAARPRTGEPLSPDAGAASPRQELRPRLGSAAEESGAPRRAGAQAGLFILTVKRRGPYGRAVWLTSSRDLEALFEGWPVEAVDAALRIWMWLSSDAKRLALARQQYDRWAASGDPASWWEYFDVA